MTVLNCYMTIQNNFILFLVENEEFGILLAKSFQIGLNYGTEFGMFCYCCTKMKVLFVNLKYVCALMVKSS